MHPNRKKNNPSPLPKESMILMTNLRMTLISKQTVNFTVWLLKIKMTKKNKLKLKVMVLKTRINNKPKSKRWIPKLPRYHKRILHQTLVSKEVDPWDSLEDLKKLEETPRLVISMLALMISMMLVTLKKWRKTLKLNKLLPQIQILDFLVLTVATISEVSVHLLKQEAQEEMKSKKKAAPQWQDLDSQVNWTWRKQVMVMRKPKTLVSFPAMVSR